MTGEFGTRLTTVPGYISLVSSAMTLTTGHKNSGVKSKVPHTGRTIASHFTMQVVQWPLELCDVIELNVAGWRAAMLCMVNCTSVWHGTVFFTVFPVWIRIVHIMHKHIVTADEGLSGLQMM